MYCGYKNCSHLCIVIITQEKLLKKKILWKKEDFW